MWLDDKKIDIELAIWEGKRFLKYILPIGKGQMDILCVTGKVERFSSL